MQAFPKTMMLVNTYAKSRLTEKMAMKFIYVQLSLIYQSQHG